MSPPSASWYTRRVHIVYALVYYFILTPLGLLFRFIGYDPLQLRGARRRESAFVTRDRAFTKKDFERA